MNKKIIGPIILIVVVLIAVIIGIGEYVFYQAQDVTEENNNSKVETVINNEDYFILYKGYEIKKELGTQFLDDMDYTDKNLEKYNINYYTYKNSKYIGQKQGKMERTFGDDEERCWNCYRNRKNSNF